MAAARQYDIPGSGTIPHALVQAYPDELTAFRAVAGDPARVLAAARHLRRGAGTGTRHLAGKESASTTGHRLTAVRLDSGDLDADSRLCRTRLDEEGLDDVKVLVSGDMDEFRIAELVAAGAPVDGFGVGGNLGVGLGSVESGTVGGVIGAVYKLAWYGGDGDERPLPGSSWRAAATRAPGRARRWHIASGDFDHDLVALEGESPPPSGRALMQPMIEDGHLVADMPSIGETKERATASLASLPPSLRQLTAESPYEVRMSDALRRSGSDRRLADQWVAPPGCRASRRSDRDATSAGRRPHASSTVRVSRASDTGGLRPYL